MNPLKDLSNHYTTPDGSVTFWILPFRNVQSEAVRLELRRIDPPAEYIHSVTGERVLDEPAEFKRDRDRAKVMNSPIVSKWEFHWLWSGLHNAFYQAEVLTTDIEFHAPPTTPEGRALQVYWQRRPTDVVARWELFKALISIDVCNLWVDAELACRDHTMDAPEPLQAHAADEPDQKKEPTPKPSSSTRSAHASKANLTLR